MAKITRYNGNLLAPASSAPGTERTIFGSTSQSDDISTNYSSELLAGWGLIGPNDAPPMQYFNAVAFTLGQVLAYLHQMGVAEWNATQEYHTGSVCVYGGKTWLSTSDSNIGNTPGVSDWVAHIVPADIGVTVQAYDADTAKTDVINTFTQNQTIRRVGAVSNLIVDADTGYDAIVNLRENGVPSLVFANSPSVNYAAIRKYDAAGSSFVSQLRFDESGNVNVAQGTFQIGGSNALKASDIGSTVQAYDADTAKLDTAANFTAGLQDNGNAVLDVADIGVTVQAYDADTAKTDVINTFTQNQTIAPATGGAVLFLNAPTGYDAKVDFRENGVVALQILNDASASKSYIYKNDATGAAISNFEWSENGDLDFKKGAASSGLFKYNGVEVATVGDIPGNISFRAYLSADNNITVSTERVFSSTIFSNLTEDFDTAGAFTPSTGVFQPSTAGYYQINISMTVYNAGEVDHICRARIYKNTTPVAADYGSTDVDDNRGGAACSVVVYLNGTTDYIQGKIQANTSGTWTALANECQISGYFVHA